MKIVLHIFKCNTASLIKYQVNHIINNKNIKYCKHLVKMAQQYATKPVLSLTLPLNYSTAPLPFTDFLCW